MKPGPSFLWSLCVVLASAALPVLEASAQTYPGKPIRMLIGFGTGGATDILGRLTAQKMGQQLGQNVIVENRPGAAGSLAIENMLAGPADGYTMIFFASSITVLPAMRAKLPYNIESDLAPISTLASGASVLVLHPSVPARSVKELIALARSQPGKLNYASSGIGSITQLRGEMLKSMGKVDIVHIPYKGSGEAVVATAIGEVDMSFPNVIAALPLIRSNKIKALAVTTIKRSAMLLSTPTIDESGLKGYNSTNWFGVWVKSGVPREIIARLNAAMVASITAPDLKDALTKEGFEPQASTPEELAALVKREIGENIQLLRAIGVKPE